MHQCACNRLLITNHIAASLKLFVMHAVQLRRFYCSRIQASLDAYLEKLLPDAPRRSILMVDSGKQSVDGG